MWIKADVTGIAPPPRSGHTATAITDKQMAVFGGACGASFFSDLHILDMSASCGHACAWPRRTPSLTANARARLRHGCADRRNWSRVMTRGVPPTPRHGHCATLVGSDSDKTPPMVRCIRAPRARVLGVRNIVSPACVCTRAAGRVWRHCFSEQPAALPQGPVPVRPRCVRRRRTGIAAGPRLTSPCCLVCCSRTRLGQGQGWSLVPQPSLRAHHDMCAS